MAKGKGGRGGGARNDNRPNGKAWKKNPGPDGVKVKFVSRPGRVDGRSAANHAAREARKTAGNLVSAE